MDDAQQIIISPRTILFSGSSDAPETDENRKLIRNAIVGDSSDGFRKTCRPSERNTTRNTSSLKWNSDALVPGVDIILQVGHKHGVDKMVRKEAKQLDIEVSKYFLPDFDSSQCFPSRQLILDQNSLSPRQPPHNPDIIVSLRRHSADDTGEIKKFINVKPTAVYHFHWDIINSSQASRFLSSSAIHHHIPFRYFRLEPPVGYSSPTYYMSKPSPPLLSSTVLHLKRPSVPTLVFNPLYARSTITPRLVNSDRDDNRKFRAEICKQPETITMGSPKLVSETSSSEDDLLALDHESKILIIRIPQKTTCRVPKSQEKRKKRHMKNITITTTTTTSIVEMPQNVLVATEADVADNNSSKSSSSSESSDSSRGRSSNPIDDDKILTGSYSEEDFRLIAFKKEVSTHHGLRRSFRSRRNLLSELGDENDDDD